MSLEASLDRIRNRKLGERRCVTSPHFSTPQEWARDGIQGVCRRESVDEYLASCEKDGVEPRRPFSGRLNVRLGPELHRRLAQSAAESGMSLNGWIRQTLEKSVSG